jgi:tetraacyldisaccharide 4'-kinase
MKVTILHRARHIAEKADKGGLIWAPLCALLTICSWLYGLSVRARRLLYTHLPGMTKRVTAHVLSVGNITVGGSGKTPLVEMYAKLWLGKNKRVAIVSRGYGKTRMSPRNSGALPTILPPQGVRVVSDGSGHTYLSPHEAGDEPFLLAQRVPAAMVLVSKNRYDASRFAVEQLGAEVIILDDAFQHSRLDRDEDIVAVDATTPFGNGHLLPRGTLREPPTSLQRATRVLLTKILPGNAESKAQQTLAQVRRVAPRVPVSLTRYVPTHLSVHPTGDTMPLEYLKGTSVLAFCGLADPVFFERTVDYLGARTVHVRRFPDHYRYTAADLASLEKDAREHGADAIVTTEKDVVRLPDGGSTERPIYAVAVEISIDD